MLVSEDLPSSRTMEVPPCRCGKTLTLAGIEASEVTAERHVFRCASCGHQPVLTVGKAGAA